MREIKYKRILTTPCPYRWNDVFIGDVNCVTCKTFKALDFKGKTLLCQGDEIFESHKAYKMFLCEKKNNYRTYEDIVKY